MCLLPSLTIRLSLHYHYYIHVYRYCVCFLGVLTPQDLYYLTTIMQQAASKWQAVGVALGFLYSDLTIIQQSPMLIPEGPTGYFREMLSQWLKWAPPNHPWPTLGALENALRTSGQESLALQLRLNFLQKEEKGSGWLAVFNVIPQYAVIHVISLSVTTAVCTFTVSMHAHMQLD